MGLTFTRRPVVLPLVAVLALPAAHLAARDPAGAAAHPGPAAYREVPDDPFVPVPIDRRVTRPARTWKVGRGLSVQVNVAPGGANIVGDAANEPSIAVDPTNPSRLAIGWRQFDTVASNFRQAGRAYSTDGGSTWIFPGVIEPGVFRSDPVLDVSAEGTFYYDSLAGDFSCWVHTSSDHGATWGPGVDAYGSDKQWLTVDRTDGSGRGHLYQNWSPFTAATFNRSTDGGASFEPPVAVPEEPYWGTSTVAPDGAVYVAGLASFSSGIAVVRSSNAQNPGAPVGFDQTVVVNLGGEPTGWGGPNPDGLLGQVWIASDHSDGPTRGNLYLLASVDPAGTDPLDVHFARSTDDGATWSAPVRVNDDPVGSNAWQWFGTMSVAPDGRIDVIWNDTRNDPGGFDSELTYAYSTDGGATWSANEVLSPPFDPHLGWPQQNKLGDYSDMVSDATGVHIAYAATFNGEQDVYYLHLDPPVLFADGFESGGTDRWSAVIPE
ncbi:MAG TPA: sialidase family protein [Methylomirabilota bacterium]|nr:sialidase family protein [Methylomirabilota bacterium]